MDLVEGGGSWKTASGRRHLEDGIREKACGGNVSGETSGRIVRRSLGGSVVALGSLALGDSMLLQ
jgi:hypothetical protein